jgi:glycosyltransferase involved in cell wall biosynthesis
MLRFAVESGEQVDWTFYCALGRRGEMDDQVISLGAKVVHSPVPLSSTLAFMRALRSEIKRGGYDTIHAHHDLVSGVYLLASAGLPVRRRIVHVHNVVDGVPTPSRLKASVYRTLLRRVCLTSADRIAGVSRSALDNFLKRPRRPGRDVVCYCAVDARPFQSASAKRDAFRTEHGLDPAADILVFAGRMVPEKEPLFAVEVLAEMVKRKSAVAGVFVGSGPMSDSVIERAKSLGLDGAFRFLGWRKDVADVLTCCDLFILPGPETPPEGLGLAVVEAQLAGLHLLFSNGIPDDALLMVASYRRLPLAAGAPAWAEAGLDLLGSPRPSRLDALTVVRESPFDLRRGLTALLDLYE